jgi:hypothetical protein
VFTKDLDELLYQLRFDDVIGRMAAAGEPQRFKDDSRVFAELEASAQSDPFWAVRRTSVEALAPIASPKIPALLRKASQDPSSSVRVAAILALGDRKDPGMAEFYKDVFKNDDSLRAQCSCARCAKWCSVAKRRVYHYWLISAHPSEGAALRSVLVLRYGGPGKARISSPPRHRNKPFFLVSWCLGGGCFDCGQAAPGLPVGFSMVFIACVFQISIFGY